LELAFAEKSLRQVCTSRISASRKLGEKTAEKLARRLADLRACDSVGEIVVGKPQEIKSTPPGEFAIELGQRSRLIFSANHNDVPTVSGKVDWSKVSRIKILRLMLE